MSEIESTPKQVIPTRWRPPAGYVLTWYPPFVFPSEQPANRVIFVYDEDEPFVEAPDIASGPDAVAYNPNGRMRKLADFDGVHPGVYALSIEGEEPGTWIADGAEDGELAAPIHADAIQVRGGVA